MYKKLLKAFVVCNPLLGWVSLASAHSHDYDPAYDHDPAPLKYEHPGDLFHSVGGTCCASGILTGVNSTGEIRSINGSMSLLPLFQLDEK
jgi:hypothetical protein